MIINAEWATDGDFARDWAEARRRLLYPTPEEEAEDRRRDLVTMTVEDERRKTLLLRLAECHPTLPIAAEIRTFYANEKPGPAEAGPGPRRKT